MFAYFFGWFPALIMINLLRSLSVKQHLKITHLHQAVEGRSLVHRTGSYLPTKGRIKWIAPQKNNDVWYWNLLQWTLRWSQNPPRAQHHRWSTKCPGVPSPSWTEDRTLQKATMCSHSAGLGSRGCVARKEHDYHGESIIWISLTNWLIPGQTLLKFDALCSSYWYPFFIEAASCLNRKAPPQKKTQNKTSAVLCKTWPHDHVTLAVICLDVVSTQALRPQPSRKKKMRKFELSQFDPEATA